MLKKSTKNQVNLNILLFNIKQRFNLSNKELIELSKEKQVFIPISIFNKELGMLESISLYLKDKLKLSFKEIAQLLKRDYKTIWTSYNKAKNKFEKIK